jgi:EAL domain-containing protein (putative c-di-GMP-specific phosphodiesterase class I)
MRAWEVGNDVMAKARHAGAGAQADRVGSNESLYIRNLQTVRQTVTAQRGLSDSPHLIYLSLAPLDYLPNIAEVIQSFEHQLKGLAAIEANRVFQVSPSDIIVVSHQSDNTFVGLVTDVRMTLVRMVREHAPQAFFTVDQEQLISVYNIARHRQEVTDLLTRLERDLPEQKVGGRGVRALETSDISRLMGYIDNMPPDQFIDDFLSWQPVVLIREDQSPRILFYEYYISMKALQETFLQGINLFLNMTLFKMLTTELDKRILSFIRREYINPVRSSFNFNIETLLSAQFENIGYNGLAKNMIVELRSSDVFSDFERFQLARQQAQRYGARLAIDGVLPGMTNVLKCENLGCAVVKIQVDGDLERVEGIGQNLRRINNADVRLVATRVESLESVRQGMRLGINRFQGFYVNKLLHSKDERERFFIE